MCAQTVSDRSDKSDRSDLSAAFAAATTIIDMRIPQQHGRAAAIAASAATLRLYAPHGRLLHYTVCSVHIRNYPYKIAVYPLGNKKVTD